MLALNNRCRYYLYQQPVDMRCGVYSLSGLVRNELGFDPMGGDVFIFIGKRGNQIRLLQWDRDGYALYLKRLEAGTFERVPSQNGELHVSLTDRELHLILQGVQMKSVRLRTRFEVKKV
jgi:transposase